jgi:SAM-dependent methyltransferase
MARCDDEEWASAVIAYEAFAPVYDAFTSRNDYELWLSKAFPVMRRHGLPESGRMLDVGCGSGNSFLPMIERGWTVTGCDVSPAMIELARGKVGEDVTLDVVDLRELPVLGEFDLVWAIDDVLNYLLDVEDLRGAISRMGRNLAPKGLLVFDVNTLATYRSAFATREVSTRGGVEVVWIGLASGDIPAGSICEARIEGNGTKTHVHRQRHYTDHQIRAAIEAAGLRCLDAFGYDDQVNLTRPPDDLRAAKVAYIAARSQESRT